MAPHTAGTTKVPDNGHEHHHRLDDNKQDGPGHDEPREIMTNENDKDHHNISGTFKDWQYLDVEHDQSPPQGRVKCLGKGPASGAHLRGLHVLAELGPPLGRRVEGTRGLGQPASTAEDVQGLGELSIRSFGELPASRPGELREVAGASRGSAGEKIDPG